MTEPNGERPRRRARTPTIIAAAATAALLGIVAVAVVATGGDDRDAPPAPTRAETAPEPSRRQPDARTLELTSTDGESTLEVLVVPGGPSRVIDARLPPVDPGRTYQLWGITDANQTSSLGLLDPTPAGLRFTPQPGVTTLAVTNEPRGGSPAPTSNPIVAGAFEP